MTSQSAFSFPDPSSFSTQQATFTSFSPEQTSEPVTNSQPNPETSNNFQNQQFQQYHTATLSSNNAKFPYLKKDEYETWALKIEYWIMNTDHNLWKIIQNGNNKKKLGRDSKGGIIILPLVSFEEHVANGNNKKSLGRDSKGGIIILPPVSFEEHVAVQREIKARTLLLQSLPKDHMADFHPLDDAREIWLAVKARFGGNEESKKMRKTMHEAENKTKEGEQMYGLMAGIKSDFADHAGNAAGSVYDAAAEFAMMEISPKNKAWPRFKESIGSDEVFDLSTPSIFDSKPKNREVKSLYERFVKAGEMHEVPPSITRTFMPTSYKYDLEETQVTFGSKSNTSESNDFVFCDNSDKSS
uniref:Xylulose kinase-1 n=1 Tax=Tanacetum cinerariifolium TaxID=118510 RepID=A0A6L2JDU6_TANCI|nr:xylulose kinase-1 [Tanacetum cinerariifolium]